MNTPNTFTYELDPPEYRRLGNLLVRVAKEAKRSLERSYHDEDDKANYRDAVLFLDKLGITEAELQEDEDGED